MALPQSSSADWQSAVSRIGNPQPLPVWRRAADCQSAKPQIGNLRYVRDGLATSDFRFNEDADGQHYSGERIRVARIQQTKRAASSTMPQKIKNGGKVIGL